MKEFSYCCSSAQNTHEKLLNAQGVNLTFHYTAPALPQWSVAAAESAAGWREIRWVGLYTILLNGKTGGGRGEPYIALY